LEKGGGSTGADANDKDAKPSPILDLMLSDTGSKLFLLLLVSKEEEQQSYNDGESNADAPRWQKFFDPYELSVLHRNPVVTENGDDAVPTSKKADETRRQELLVYLKDLLVEVCTKHAGEIMRSKSGSRVLMEVCDNFPGEELFGAIVEDCAGEDEKETVVPMVEDPVGHLALKHMFLSESSKELDDEEPSLARMFYSKFDKSLGRIASSNRGAFVLSALLQTFMKEDVKKALKDHKKDIDKLAKKKKLAGCGILLEALKA
jgi:hypothetical protein